MPVFSVSIQSVEWRFSTMVRPRWEGEPIVVEALGQYEPTLVEMVLAYGVTFHARD